MAHKNEHESVESANKTKAIEEVEGAEQHAAKAIEAERQRIERHIADARERHQPSSPLRRPGRRRTGRRKRRGWQSR